MSIIKYTTRVMTFGFFVLVSGCMTPPPTIVQQPLSARPIQQPNLRPANGAIFQTNANQGLFADRTPSQVGDILTVIIEERANISNSESSSGSRSASGSASAPGFSIPFFPNYLEAKTRGLNVNINGEVENDGSGKSSASSSFNTNISVTVIDVLPNGNLQVSGEKQVKMNGEMQYIRLSGIINPRDVKVDPRLGGNIVSSQKMADARIEQINKGNNSLFAQPGWLTRFFMTILPF